MAAAELTTTVTATAATNGKRRRSARARDTRTYGVSHSNGGILWGSLTHGLPPIRDIHGMILGDMVGAPAESPGGSAAGQGVTYALENC
jgi:hypothetical protein